MYTLESLKVTNWNECQAVEQSPGRVSGVWLFAGTQIPLYRLYENLAAGASIDDIIEWFPGVKKEQVRLVLEHEAVYYRTSLIK